MTNEPLVREVESTLKEVDAMLGAARRQARAQGMGLRAPAEVLDENGRPVLTDLVCAKANLLTTLARLVTPDRGEDGDGSLVGTLVVIIIIAALASIVGLPVVEWFEAAVAWTADAIRGLGDLLNGR